MKTYLGFEAQPFLTEKFKTVSFEHLKAIQKKYQANFAVVVSESEISRNVIYKNERLDFAKKDKEKQKLYLV